MTVTRGKVHVFLGMRIKYKNNGTAEVSMRDYLQEVITELEMDIKKTVATLAQMNLFNVNPDAKRLGKHKAEVFHSVVAKLLYVSKCVRMDILLGIGFLCTRVLKCTMQDKTKLRRVLEYWNGTLDLVYTLGADSLQEIRLLPCIPILRGTQVASCC